MVKEFIQEHLKKKLRSNPSLVIYDPKLFYRDLVLEMQNDSIKVFDASENVIIARENALDYWVNKMPKNSDRKLISYVPYAKTNDEDKKTQDPFAIFSSIGACFPDQAADDYLQLCIAALPDEEEKIKEYFKNGKTPSFSAIDALEGGIKYPQLKNGLKVSSNKEIILAILSPNFSQEEFLKNESAWKKELRLFINEVLGVSLQSKKLKDIQKEIWLIILFSEFAHDLPIDLPKDLKDVPVSKESSEILIKELCAQIRYRKDLEELYIHEANRISEELKLPSRFKGEENLGNINTFAFEDSSFYIQFKSCLVNGELEKAEKFIEKSSDSIWSIYDKERSLSWLIAKKSCNIIRMISELDQSFQKTNSLNDIANWYAEKGYKLDTHHRELDKSINELISQSQEVKEVHKYVINAYLKFMDKVQQSFNSRVVSEGLASLSINRNIHLYDEKVEPLVKTGKKTVYILADALRYELAAQLGKGLERASFEYSLEPSLAFIPTVTKFAMAALMPKASKALELKLKGNSLEPYLNGDESGTRNSRIKYVQNVLGDKATWAWEKDVLQDKYEKSDLLIVTTTEVDQAGESSPDNAQLLIETALNKILKLSTRLKEDGYEEFILAADHGFVLLDEYRAGNKANKPIGDWALSKSRCVAGKGDSDDNHIHLKAQDLGVSSEVDQFLFLKNYATYDRGKQFFHEGLSLQEIITPFLKFTPKAIAEKEDLQVNLTYRGKTSGIITTLRPSLELASFGNSLFEETVDLLIEVLDNEGNIVGKPASSEIVNSTTGYLEIKPGASLKFTLAMEEEFEGEFRVVAKSPASGLIFSEINLETEYF